MGTAVAIPSRVVVLVWFILVCLTVVISGTSVTMDSLLGGVRRTLEDGNGNDNDNDDVTTSTTTSTTTNQDFAELDALLGESHVRIAETVLEDLPFPFPSNSEVRILDLYCDGMGVDDVRVSFDRVNRYRTLYDFEVVGVDINCRFDWTYSRQGLFVEESEAGTGRVETLDNGIGFQFRLFTETVEWDPVTGVVMEDSNANFFTSLTTLGNSPYERAYPPIGVSLRSCGVSLNFEVLKFSSSTESSSSSSGSSWTNVLNGLTNFVGNALEVEIRRALCQGVQDLSRGNFTSALRWVADTVEAQLDSTERLAVDPLAPQKRFDERIQKAKDGADGTGIVDLRTLNENGLLANVPDGSVSSRKNRRSVSSMLLQRLNDLGQPRYVYRPQANNNNNNNNNNQQNSGGQWEWDLAINEYMRQNVLRGRNGWVVPVYQIPWLQEPLVLDGTRNEAASVAMDGATATVRLQEIVVRGLNTFRTFHPWNVTAAQTWNSRWSMERLAVEVTVQTKLTIPESLNEQFIMPSRGAPLELKFSARVNELSVDLSSFVALRWTELSQLRLGDLVYWERIGPCLLSTTPVRSPPRLSQLEVTVGSYQLPTLTGLIAPGVDAIVADLVNDVADLYGGMLDPEVLSNWIATSLRQLLNEQLTNMIGCPRTPFPSVGKGHMDWSAIFPSHTTTTTSSSSRSSTLGSFPIDLSGLIRDLSTPRTTEETRPVGGDADGDETKGQRIAFNDDVIGPMTRSQSGIPGKVFVTIDALRPYLTDDESSSVDMDDITPWSIRLRDLAMEHVDTFVSPTELLVAYSDQDDHTHTHHHNQNQNKNNNDHGHDHDPLVLYSHLTLGTPMKPLKVQFTMDVSYQNQLVETVSLQFRFVGLSLDVATRLAMLRESVESMKVEDLNDVSCWFAVLNSLVVDPVTGLASLPPSVPNYPPVGLVDLVMQPAATDDDDDDDDDQTTPWVDVDLLMNEQEPRIVRILKEKGLLEFWIHELLTGSSLMDWYHIAELQSVVDRFVHRVGMECQQQQQQQQQQKQDLLGYEFERSLNISDDTVNLAVALMMAAVKIGVAVVPEKNDRKLQETTEFDFVPPDDLVDLMADDGNFFIEFLERVGFQGLFPRVSALQFPPAFLESLLPSFVKVKSVVVNGLGTVRDASVHSTSARTMAMSFGMDRLTLAVDMRVVFDDNANDNDDTGRRFVMELELQDLAVRSSLQVELNRTKLGDIELGHLLQTSEVIPCLASTLESLEVLDLQGSASAVLLKETSESLPPRYTKELKQLDAVLEETYGSSALALQLEASVEEDMGALVRLLLNAAIRRTVNNAKCTPVVTFSNDEDEKEVLEIVDFRDLFFNASDAAEYGATGTMPYGDVPPRLFGYVNNELALVEEEEAEGLPRINSWVVQPLTQAQSGQAGTLTVKGDLLSFTANLTETFDLDGGVSSAQFRLRDLSIEHIDSVGLPFKLFHPRLYHPHVLTNALVLGSTGPERPLRVSFTVEFGLDDNNINDESSSSSRSSSSSSRSSSYHNVVSVEIQMTNAELHGALMAKLDQRKLLQLPVRDARSIHCWLATAALDHNDVEGSALSFVHVDLRVQHMDVSVRCVSCTDELAQELQGSDFDNDLARGETYNVTARAQELLDLTNELLTSDAVQDRLDALLADSARQCTLYDAGGSSLSDSLVDNNGTLRRSNRVALHTTLIVLAIVSALWLWIGLVSLLARRSVRRRYEQWICRLNEDDLDQLHSERIRNERIDSKLRNQTRALGFSAEVPRVAKILIPLLVLTNVGLFLSGHLNIGGVVVNDVFLAGDRVNVPNFYSFSILQTVSDMWAMGIKSMAVVAFVASVLWPYVKQSSTLLLWFAPPTRISPHRRGHFLVTLEALAKWSILDIFILMLALVCLRVKIQSPVGSTLEGLYDLDTRVVPQWGLYANAIAQVLSQILSHFVMAYHDRVVRSIDRSSSSSPPEPVSKESSHSLSLRRHTYRADGVMSGRWVRPSRCADVTVGLAFVGTLALLLTGFILPSYRVEVAGLVGTAMDASTSSATRSLSVWGTAGAVVAQATGSAFGLVSLSVLFVVTTVVVPLAQTVALAVLWHVPLRPLPRHRCLAVTQLMGSWQFLEVFLLSVLLWMWQVTDVTELMVAELCASLDDGFFRTLGRFGLLDVNNGTDTASLQCFTVTLRPEPSLYLLLVASLLLTVLHRFVTSAAHQVRNDGSLARRLDLSCYHKTKGTKDDDHDDDDDHNMEDSYRHPPDATVAENFMPPVQFVDTYRCLLVTVYRSYIPTSSQRTKDKHLHPHPHPHHNQAYDNDYHHNPFPQGGGLPSSPGNETAYMEDDDDFDQDVETNDDYDDYDNDDDNNDNDERRSEVVMSEQGKPTMIMTDQTATNSYYSNTETVFVAPDGDRYRNNHNHNNRDNDEEDREWRRKQRLIQKVIRDKERGKQYYR